MTFTRPERRRAVRATLAGASWLAVPAKWPVELLDLSIGGIAFRSPHAIEVGRTAGLRVTLGSEALNCEIRVCWTRPRTGTAPVKSPPYEVGAVFLPLDDSSRRALETFLKVSPAK